MAFGFGLPCSRKTGEMPSFSSGSLEAAALAWVLHAGSPFACLEAILRALSQKDRVPEPACGRIGSTRDFGDFTLLPSRAPQLLAGSPFLAGIAQLKMAVRSALDISAGALLLAVVA